MFYLPFMFICTFQRKAAFSSINISVLFGAFFQRIFILKASLTYYYSSSLAVCKQVIGRQRKNVFFSEKDKNIYFLSFKKATEKKRYAHSFFSQYLPQKEEYVCHFYFESAALKALDKKDFIVPFIENYFCYPLGRECFFPSIWENSQKEMN